MDTLDDAAISHFIPSVQLTGSRKEKLRKLDTLLHHLLQLRGVLAGEASSHPSLVGTYGSTRGTWRPFTAGLVTGAVIAALLLVPSMAHATPSTTFWAPSTASCQPRGVPHVTYDTYFWRGPSVGSQGAPGYPVDTGLTAGILPFNKLQAEAGFDLLLPSPEPLFLNGKLCTPESSLFAGSPGISFGFYNLGFKKDVTSYNVLHVMAQKGLPFGGYVAAGLYRGFNRTLFTNSDGKVVQTGLMIAAASPDIQIGLKGLKKIYLAADAQTGKNVLGAWGFGSYIYFADNVSLLVGPVFFLDKNLQPGASKYMWTAQLDIDIPLGR